MLMYVERRIGEVQSFLSSEAGQDLGFASETWAALKVCSLYMKIIM